MPDLSLCKKLLAYILLKAKGSLHWLLSFFSRLCKLGLGTHNRLPPDIRNNERLAKGYIGTGVQPTLATSLVPRPLNEQQVISPIFHSTCSATIRTPPSSPTSSRPRPFSEETLFSLHSIPETNEGGTLPSILMSPGRWTSEPGVISSIHHNRIRCTLPSERPRYDREIVIKSHDGPFKFDPIGTFISYKDQGRGDWEYNVHPEGQPYYKYKGRFTYLTENDVWNNSTLNKLERFIEVIERRAEKYNNNERKLNVAGNRGTIENEDVEVVLEIMDDDWSYYMVDLSRRGVFWLEKYEFGAEYNVEKCLQLCHNLDFEFWQHIEYFPNRQPIEGLIEELMGNLSYIRIDLTTSADTTAPYSEGDCSSLISSLKHLEALKKSKEASCYIVVSCARIMAVLANERTCNFYGFNGARLSATQSVRGQVNKRKNRSWLVRILSPLLFYAPETHLTNLEKLWVDGVIKDRRWKTFQTKLERDWEGFVLTSTVLLNANVAILSVPIVISDQNSYSSPAAIASQVSIVVSLGSIIIGLLLVRQIRISAKNDEYTAADAMSYLTKREHEQLGLETMAIQYSLPYALLMWGMVTFLAAIAIASFLKIRGQPNDLSRGIFGAVWFFTLPLIMWTVLTGWETTHKMHWKDIAIVRWWQISSKAVKCFGRRSKGEDNEKCDNDVETGSRSGTCSPSEGRTGSDPSNEPLEDRQKRRPSWRPRFRVPGPVRRLTTSYPI